MSAHEIAIAGAGIGGLSAAIALALKGFPVTVFEREAAPGAEGAGIQLGPNATRVLARLEMLTALEAHAVPPEVIAVRDALSGNTLVQMRIGDEARRRHGAPYLVVHRGDLHRVLMAAAGALPNIELVTGAAVTGFKAGEDSVEVMLTGGRLFRARVLVGADGLWSNVRGGVLGDEPPAFTGEVAWRGLVPAERFAFPGPDREVGLWLGPGGHLVHYPVEAGRSVNVVAVAAGKDPGRGWSRKASAERVQNAFSHWTRLARDVVACVEDWRQWPLHDRPADTKWTQGPVTLLGDAAHPMRPYLAQGGAMAIEDAFVLADCLDRERYHPKAGLMAYETKRLARTARVQEQSRANAERFHMRGPARLVRNLVIMAAGSKMIERYDWLYGADVTAGTDP